MCSKLLIGKNNAIYVALLVMMFCNQAFGNTDTLGLANFWNRLIEIANDPFLSRTIFFALICIGIWRAFAGAGFMQMGIMIILGLLFLNIESIVNALSTGAML